jgi:hypothetical protein
MRKILLTGAALIMATALACAQSTGTPNKSMGMNNTGVTGQLSGTQSGNMSGKPNKPAMQSSTHTMPKQRRSTMSKTAGSSGT